MAFINNTRLNLFNLVQDYFLALYKVKSSSIV